MQWFQFPHPLRQQNREAARKVLWKFFVPTPDLYPLTIEWPDELYHRPEESVLIGTEASKVPFFDVGIDLIDPEPGAPLRFKVYTEDFSASYELTFGAKKVAYIPETQDI